MTDVALEREAIALFEQLLDVPEAERGSWLDARIAGRAELRARIEALRAADAEALIRTGGAAGEIAEPPVPARLGGYRLLERIGRGGMGSVYRAERDRGDFVHTAAIKIIKPGLLSETLAGRFRRERQTLARLSHPGIAQLFDGGETEDGAPFIVMELVEGLPLLAWVEERSPPLRARLDLFRQACAAVAFAHANLIVHRDITPSNILVTPDARAKLIDFGIARPMETGDAAPSAGPSLTPSLSLTPGYAAPERLVSEAVTTAADVYSLGKVLERLIAPQPPPELAAIVARAAAPLPEHRYPTVEALADDVLAWSDGRPVAAWPQRRGYVARKFVRRHRAWVGAAAAAALLLVVAVTATSWSYFRAEQAREEAERRFAQTRAIANSLLFGAYDEVSKLPGSTRARAYLARTGVRYLDALADRPDVPRDVRVEVGRGYTRLAQVTGSGVQGDLGRYADANALLAQADRILTPLYRGQPGDPAAARAYADLLVEQAGVNLYNNNEPQRARAQARLARTVLGGQERSDPDAARLYALALQSEGDSLVWTGDHVAARDALRRVGPFVAALPPAIRGLVQLRSVQATSLRLLAEAHHKLKEEDQAFAAIDRAVALNERLHREHPGDPQITRRLTIALWYRGVIARTAMQDARAAASIAAAMRLARMLRERDPSDGGGLQMFAAVAEVQAQILADQRRFADSFAVTDQVIATQIDRARLAGNTAGALRGVASAYRIGGGNHHEGGDYAGACAMWRKSLAIFREFERTGKLTPMDRDGSFAEMKDYVRRGCSDGPPRSVGDI